jgi:hypothetical protein
MCAAVFVLINPETRNIRPPVSLLLCDNLKKQNVLPKLFFLSLFWEFFNGRYCALQITFRLSPVQIVNFLCPIDEIPVIRASIEHKKLTI